MGKAKKSNKISEWDKNSLANTFGRQPCNIRWCVDASYAIHNDYKGHTGLMMTMKLGAIIKFSRKQMMNGESSTETGLIGVNDALLQILWARYFMESQGYKNGRKCMIPGY